MGTRFVATQEAPVHPDAKAALVRATERDTQLIFRTLRNTSRVLRNVVSEEVVSRERRPEGCRFEELLPLVAGARGRHAWESGETNAGVMTAGLVVGLIEDIPSCSELIERTVSDALAHLQRAAGWASRPNAL